MTSSALFEGDYYETCARASPCRLVKEFPALRCAALVSSGGSTDSPKVIMAENKNNKKKGCFMVSGSDEFPKGKTRRAGGGQRASAARAG